MFSFATATLSNIIAYALVTVFAIVGNLTAIAAKGLNYAIFVRPGGNILIVATTWKILRDFSNMFFIIMLIYVAFATIFDHGNYTFQKMIVRFVIVAVLINFSLVIGNLVIDACQVLTNIFLGSIGNLGDRLGQVLNPSLLLPNASNMKGIDLAGAGLISLVFAIILSLIFLFSLLVAMVFAIVRVPIIWGLLIISPLAWMSHILPSSEGWWKKWWSQFFGWNLFLPVYLFFIYLGLLFLSQRDVIMNAVIQTSTAGGVNPANGALLAGLGDSLSFNVLFFYLFAAFVMWGGTWAATKTTSLMGTGFDKGLGWAKWTVKNFPTPGIGSLTNWQEATKQRKDQFIREGAFGYFGTEKSERDTARIASNKLLFGGVKGALEKGVELEKKKQKPFSNNTEELNILANTGSTQQKIAARTRLTELGALDPARIEETYSWLGGDRNEAANKYLGGIDFTKLSDKDRERLLNSTKIADIEIRKKIITAMIEKDTLNKDRIGKLIETIAIRDESHQILNMAQLKDILDKGNKKNLLATAQVKLDMGFESDKNKKFEDILQDSLKKMTDDQIIETMNELKDLDDIKKFNQAMEKVFQKGSGVKRLETLAGKAAGDTAAKLDDLVKATKSKVSTPKIDKEVKKREKAVDGIQAAATKLDQIEKQIRGMQGQIALNPSPSSDDNKRFRAIISDLEKQRDAKNNDIKSLNENIEKIAEKIENINTGTSTTP